MIPQSSQVSRRRGFEHYFGTQDLPKPIEKSRLDTLVRRLKAGDQSVEQEIVDGHIRLATSIVAAYATWYPHKTDDMVGAACLGIAQAVRWAPERLYDDNITPYIYATCERFVREFLERDQLVRIPRSAFKKLIEETGNIEFLPLVRSIDKPPEDEENPLSTYEMYQDLAPETIDTYDFIFVEVINSLNLSERERSIVEMSIEGYTVMEIGEKLGVTHQMVTHTKSGIGEKIIRSKRRDLRGLPVHA